MVQWFSYLRETDVQAVQDQIEATGKLLSGLIRNTRRRLDSLKEGGTIEQMSH